jgi:hypothetical protein
MTHVHYDLASVETMMRNLRLETLTALLEGPDTAMAKDAYRVQDRFFEAQLAIQLQMVRLLNEGRDPQFIGRVIGGVIGSITVNTLAASSDIHACWTAIEECVAQNLEILGGTASDAIVTGCGSVQGTQGGRA